LSPDEDEAKPNFIFFTFFSRNPKRL
jgi:hypothetical protein